MRWLNNYFARKAEEMVLEKNHTLKMFATEISLQQKKED